MHIRKVYSYIIMHVKASCLWSIAECIGHGEMADEFYEAVDWEEKFKIKEKKKLLS